ncbi:hypothetical protein HOY80DRAFT_1083225 [Tuber brumale]|nr:hypothetical protein HOY80DRAFT_1083225 [Tuber brumale]
MEDEAYRNFPSSSTITCIIQSRTNIPTTPRSLYHGRSSSKVLLDCRTPPSIPGKFSSIKVAGAQGASFGSKFMAAASVSWWRLFEKLGIARFVIAIGLSSISGMAVLFDLSPPLGSLLEMNIMLLGGSAGVPMELSFRGLAFLEIGLKAVRIY